MTFKKLMRLIAIGMMKVLGCLSKGKLHQIESFETEVFNQIILCAQKARPIDVRHYESTNVTMVGNVLTVRFGKCYQKILPVIEDSRLIEKLITYHYNINLKVEGIVNSAGGNAMKAN